MPHPQPHLSEEAEEPLVREQLLLRTLMDNLPDRVYFKDRFGRFTRTNKAVAVRFGLDDPAQINGKTDADFFSPDAVRVFRTDEEEVIRTGRPLFGQEDKEIWPDGRVTWASTTTVPLTDAGGQVVGIVGISRDITERKRTEEALQASEARYQALVENLTQSVFLKDHSYRFQAVNQPFCRGLNLHEKDILGKTDFDLYPEALAQKYRADDEKVLKAGQRLEHEEENIIAGQVRTTHVVKTPFRDSQGCILGVLGSFWDVTEQRRMEGQLRQAQKMEALGQLAGGVAHDFNNLLTAILGNVALVTAELPHEDRHRELLLEAERAGTRAAELTHQLLSFTRQAVLRLERIDLTAAMQEILGIVRRTIDPRVRVDKKTAPGLWAVQADPGQLSQVLLNLCLNARDAMPEGGQLLLEAANVILDQPTSQLHAEGRPGEFICLQVTDTGRGIPADIRARIFEPFFTTKGPGKGTGLGLAIVYGIVKQHQGWIECRSEVARGTCFTVYLPRDPHDLAGPAQRAARPPVPRGAGETVLLVDDEPLVRNLGRAILESNGYQVLLAEDGLEAVEIYTRKRDRIAVVILDMAMPRLSGRDTLGKLRAINPRLRALISSGYSADQANLLTDLDLLGFVGKPYFPQDLLQSVREILDRAAD